MMAKVNPRRHLIAYAVMGILIVIFSFRILLPGLKTTPAETIIATDGENRSLNLPPLRYDSLLFPPPEPEPEPVVVTDPEAEPEPGVLVLRPTMLAIHVSPNPVRMFGAAHILVSGDGHGVPIMINAQHMQSEEIVVHPGLLNPGGQFETDALVNRPGKWQFTAQYGANVTSGTFDLVAQGIEVVVHDTIYMMSTDDVARFTIFTHLDGDVGLWASRDNWVSEEVYVTSSDIDSEGICTIEVNLTDVLGPGRWELDARIGDFASEDFAGSAYLEVIE